MADAVIAKILRNTDSEASFLFGNASDGTGESAVQKVDISALVMAATKVTITKLIWGCDGMQVKILFDHTTDDLVAILAGNGRMNDVQDCAIQDPGSSGDTGDILFTTAGQTAGDGYLVYMEIRKVA
jgi:hypothetical protein